MELELTAHLRPVLGDPGDEGRQPAFLADPALVVAGEDRRLGEPPRLRRLGQRRELLVLQQFLDRDLPAVLLGQLRAQVGGEVADAVEDRLGVVGEQVGVFQGQLDRAVAHVEGLVRVRRGQRGHEVGGRLGRGPYRLVEPAQACGGELGLVPEGECVDRLDQVGVVEGIAPRTCPAASSATVPGADGNNRR